MPTEKRQANLSQFVSDAFSLECLHGTQVCWYSILLCRLEFDLYLVNLQITSLIRVRIYYVSCEFENKICGDECHTYNFFMYITEWANQCMHVHTIFTDAGAT